MSAWYGIEDDKTGLFVGENSRGFWYADFAKTAPWQTPNREIAEMALARGRKKLRRKLTIVGLDSKGYRDKKNKDV